MDLLNIALPALAEAAGIIATPSTFLYLCLGVVVGLCVGVLPGLGGIAGLSLVLPFVYGLDTASGLALMIGLVAVIPTSDTFASVLLGIPGSAASQATVLDGFPLSSQGHAARALSAAFMSSLFGGLFGAVVLSVFILVARPLVLSFGVPELLLLTILGFSMVSVLSGRSPLKGLIAVALGMIVASIGEAPAEGSQRMTFGNWYLQDGLTLVIVGLGIFAIPEILGLLREDKPISKSGGLGSGWVEGIRDWWQNKWLSIRCATIGVIVGVIPGLGGAVVDWIAYGHTVQTTKDRSRFGKGEIRGVIGPESSNNAKEGGGLVPTLLFGVPGSGAMAVFLAGMVLLGIEAGPAMMRQELPLTYSIVWSLAIANVVGAGLAIAFSGGIARVTTIPFPLFAPFLLIVISFTAFQSGRTMWDLVALVCVGILGIMLKRFDWPRPAFLIGFVLASQAEVYTYQATQIATVRHTIGGWSSALGYLLSPVGICILFVIAGSLWLAMRNKPQGDDDTPPFRSRTAPLIFAAFIAAVLAFAMFDSMGLSSFIDQIFPIAVSALGLLAALVLIWQVYRNAESPSLHYDAEAAEMLPPRSIWQGLFWIVGLVGMIAMFGFAIGATLFVSLFLIFRANVRWYKAVIGGLLGAGLVVGLSELLGRDLPQSVITMAQIGL